MLLTNFIEKKDVKYFGKSKKCRKFATANKGQTPGLRVN